MNSTISVEQFKTGDTVYVPFWVVLDFLDATPPDPFVIATVLSNQTKRLMSPAGPITVTVCDLELKSDLIATAIPITYLIAPDKLVDWSIKIADWFINYPKKQNNKAE